MRITATLAVEPFDPHTESRAFQSGLRDEGAIVSFVGIARPHSTTGSEVTCLFLDHHPRLTERSLWEVAHDTVSRFGCSAIRIVHRCGKIAPGEAIVFVAAAAIHRRAAFEAVEYAMDRLKTDAVFWKREDAVDGSRWIEPTGADHADRARWSK